MKWLQNLLQSLHARAKMTRRGPQPVSHRPPSLEALEDRTVPSGFSAIQSTFNGTGIAFNPVGSGSFIWYNSVLKASGISPTDTVTINFVNQFIDFTDHKGTSGTADDVPYHLAVPNATITFSPSTTLATTTFNTATNTWITNVPSSGLSGNVFASGLAFQVPVGGLPGGIKPVTWSGTFTTSAPAGVSVQWKWGAAIYTQFSTDPNALGVKPVDGNGTSAYQNSHHAGTPENFTTNVTGGARGGGGSNYTGSYSGTQAVIPGLAPASLSGFVYLDSNDNGIREAGELGIAGVSVTLTGTDDLGQPVHVTITTAPDGSYNFANLRPGTYRIAETQPSNYLDGKDTIGTQGGILGDDEFLNISLGAGINGINNNFGERDGIFGE